MRIDRKPSGALLIHGVASAVALSAAVAVGVGLGFRLDAPTTVTKTVTHEIPPTCLEIEAAVQAERARAADIDEAAAAVDVLLAGLDDVVLTRDEDQIATHAEHVDDAMRLEQAAELALATAQADLDTAVSKCTPERPE